MTPKTKSKSPAKTVALLAPNYEAEAISIEEIKLHPSTWRGREFYCVAGLFPMSAGPRRDPPMFYFKSRENMPQGANRSGGGEGAVHELAKLHLAATRRVSIEIDEKILNEPPRVFDFEFSKVELEVPLNINGKTYWVDLLGTLQTTSPHIERFGFQIGIEICDQHAVDRCKLFDLQRAGLTTIEIKLSKDMHLTHEEAAIRANLVDRRAWLKNFFERTVYAKFLHREDHRDLVERRKKAEKTQTAIPSDQHSPLAIAESTPTSIQCSVLADQSRKPIPTQPAVAEAPRIVPAVPLVSAAPKTQPATTPTPRHASMPAQTAPLEPRKPGVFERISGWWKSLWAA